jgi:15,16-dihydrobiliverdin:ferredoxin oxidoreductase
MYRPFLEHLEASLQQRFDLNKRSIPEGLECNISERGRHPATIQSWCYECTELRKARYTYIDAGQSAQIFNSVIYPGYQYDYITPLKALHDKYPDLAQNLEMKFYDANQYFSKYLLFAKTDPETVKTRALEAFKDYLQLYWEMLAAATPDTSNSAIARITKAQRDYDQYSAERDPASGLFSSYFGHDWSEKFLYGFLFEDAVPLAVSASK